MCACVHVCVCVRAHVHVHVHVHACMCVGVCARTYMHVCVCVCVAVYVCVSVFSPCIQSRKEETAKKRNFCCAIKFRVLSFLFSIKLENCLKIKFSVKDFFSNGNEIFKKVRIYSYLL